MNLYLDDIRDPHTSRDWTIVRSYDEAIKTMERYGCPKYMSFDHDLGDNVPSGYDVAKWMIDKDISEGGTFIPYTFEFNVHSANPVGAANIEGIFKNYLKFKLNIK